MGNSSTKKPSEQRAQEEAFVARVLKEMALDERQKNGRHQNRAIATSAVRERMFLDELKDVFGKVFANKISVKPYKSKTRAKTKRVLNLLWSDHHYGAMLDPREVPLKFGPVEEARRLAAICRQTADYKRHYRDDTELFIHLAGDMIQGQLHDMRDGAPLAEQFASALHCLTQGISFLASEFKQVTVRCTPGNHGRNTSRHKERATNQKWDSIENMLYSALAVAFQKAPNVRFDIGYKPYYVYETFGNRGFITHGDSVISPGYPGSNLNIASVRKQINEYNATLKDHEKVTVFAVGHVHVGSIVHLPNGAIFISNGCLIPPDAYAQSIGIFDTSCGQWLWESVPGHAVGDHRFIVVDEHTDKDKSLDAIVQPFKGF